QRCSSRKAPKGAKLTGSRRHSAERPDQPGRAAWRSGEPGQRASATTASATTASATPASANPASANPASVNRSTERPANPQPTAASLQVTEPARDGFVLGVALTPCLYFVPGLRCRPRSVE